MLEQGLVLLLQSTGLLLRTVEAGLAMELILSLVSGFSTLPLPLALGSSFLWYPEMCLGRKTTSPASSQIACGPRKRFFFILNDVF